jgi:hypothetical protein
MATVPFAAAPFAVGRTLSPDAAIPLNVVRFDVTFDVTAVALEPATRHFAIGTEISYDGGTTWQHNISGGFDGGWQPQNKDGTPSTVARVGGFLPQPTNANRRVRAFVNVTEDDVTRLALTTVLGPGQLVF